MERVLQTWRDVCEAVLPNGHIITNEVYSFCPPKTVCASILDTDGDLTIQCEPVESPGKKEDPKPGTKSPQIGSSNLVMAVTSLKPTQFDIPVTLAADTHATVTASVLSKFSLPITLHQPC